MERMEESSEDARLDRLLALAPAREVPAALERRILADFDRIAARGSLGKALRRAADLVWPGVPAWAPACAFALSLMIGLGVAAFAPLELPQSDEAAFAVDQSVDIDGSQGV